MWPYLVGPSYDRCWSAGCFGAAVDLLDQCETRTVADPCLCCAWSVGQQLLRLSFHWHILRVEGSRGPDGLRRKAVGCSDDVTRHGAAVALLLLRQMTVDAIALIATSPADRTMELLLKTGETTPAVRILQLTWLWR
jgi:hypothetical protein